MDTMPIQWSAIERLIFRFFFLLLILFMFFFNNGTLPLFYFITKPLNVLLHQFIPWLGKSIFKLPYDITVFTNGSGDTTYDYLLLFCVAFLSVMGTMLWSALDRKSTNYNRLYYWLTVCVRFYVGLMLINYGMVKVIQLQFPAPGLVRMLSTYGDSSPMGLAWTFLGFSKGYNLFMGIAELFAGLLLFRRTVTIGAMITLMTTANVMAVNYFYDVPVKIVSTALVIMCLFLLAPNFIRLFKLFFKGEAIALRTIAAPLISKRWKRNTKYTLKYLLIAYLLLGGVTQVLSMNKIRGAAAPKSPLYGAYQVDRFVKGNQLILASDTTVTRWEVLVLQGVESGAIKDKNGIEYAKITTDTVNKKIKFVFATDPNSIHELSYTKNGNQLFLNGLMFSDSLQINLSKIKFELIERELNWINERPYNR